MSHSKLVMVDWGKYGPDLFRIESDQEITTGRVVKYLEETEDFDESRDTVYLFDENEIQSVNIDIFNQNKS